MKINILIFINLFLLTCIQAQQKTINYPILPKSAVDDHYFGTSVEDPYRFLEYDSLPETKKWLNEEKDLTESYRKKLSHRYPIETQLRFNSHYDFGTIHKSGKYYFEYIGTTLKIKKNIKGLGTELIRTIDYEHGDHVSFAGFVVSEDNEHIAISISRNGSDWREIRVIGLYPAVKYKDIIKDVKFSSVAWKGDGFYYSKYENNKVKQDLKSALVNHKIYYHHLGDLQEKDELIYENRSDIYSLKNFQLTSDSRFLIVYDTKDIGNKKYLSIKYTDLNSGGKIFKDLITKPYNESGNYSVIDYFNNKFLVWSDYNTPNGHLILIDPSSLNQEIEFVKEYKQVIESVYLINNKVICIYLNNLDYHCITFNETGKVIDNISFPVGCSVKGFEGKNTDTTTTFYLHSFLHPPIVYQYNLNTLVTKNIEKTEIPYDVADFEIKKVFYYSKDSTRIPMFIAYRKGTKLDGNNPTILYGYGGYGIVYTPFFNRGFINFMQNWGIIALPCIRGGGEYGDNWHEQGMLGKKQNVFDDFIAAAEYLIDKKITNSEKLALMGGSNGGLLVGAVLTQRPELFKVAVAQVGVYDMLRYHKFTIGHAWISEYGTSDDPEQFKYLYKYSPLHNVKQGVDYPATLILTGDHDDRVVPLHSYKFAATLQEKSKGNNPILLFVGKNSGHSSGDIYTQAFIYSFIYSNMGIKPTAIMKLY